MVKPQLSDFMGTVFENICQQYLFLPDIYAELPFTISEIGRWWGNNPKERRQEEIDIMAVLDNKALFGECKWKNEKVEREVIDTLLSRGELFQYPEKYYYVFSKSGFREDAVEYSQIKENVRLISFEEMCDKTIKRNIDQ